MPKHTEGVQIGTQAANTRQEQCLLWPLVALALVVFISRVPFVSNGYGVDADCYRVVQVGRKLLATGVYEPSRFPGYPIQEIATAYVLQFGPAAANAISAFLSAVAAVYFALFVRELGVKWWLAGGAALAFIPAIYVQSVSTSDLAWALGFACGGLYYGVRGKPIAAGIMIGLATGCRLTMITAVLPISVLLWPRVPKASRIKSIVLLSVVSGVVAAIAFLPLFTRYGLDFISYNNHGRPPLSLAIRRATTNCWGKVGFVAIIIGSIVALCRLARGVATLDEHPKRFPSDFLALGLGLALNIAPFIQIPYETGYLTPAMPYFAALLFLLLSSRQCLFVCLMLLVSSFVDFGKTGFRPGLIFDDAAVRKANGRHIDMVIKEAKRLPPHSSILAGWWQPMILATLPLGHQEPEFIFRIHEADVTLLEARGRKLYYLADVLEWNKRYGKVDMTKHGAVVLNVPSAYPQQTPSTASPQ